MIYELSETKSGLWIVREATTKKVITIFGVEMKATTLENAACVLECCNNPLFGGVKRND